MTVSGVLSLGPGDFQRAGEVLAEAFEDDVLWGELLAETALRARMFAGVARTIPAAGGVAERTAGFEGVALWQAPGKEIGLGAVVRSGFAPMRWLPRLPMRALRPMMAMQRQVEATRHDLVPEPHWRLLVLGVAPGDQGRGMGSALVRSGLERADRDGKPVYVETNSEGNVGFYGSFGFDLVDKTTVVGTEVPMWFMVRP